MKMTTYTEQQFNQVIESLDQDSLTQGHDVGRMHGIICYYRNGKHIGTESWVKENTSRVFTYEVASYLLEAYAK